MAYAALAGCGDHTHAVGAGARMETLRDTLRATPVPAMPAGLASTAFASGATPAFDAAWISDELVAVPTPSDSLAPPPQQPPLRFTGLAEHGPHGWHYTAVCFSRAVPDSVAATLTFAAPATLPDSVPADAAELVRRFRAQFESHHAPSLADREEVVALGPGGDRGFGPEPARAVLEDWWKRGRSSRVTGNVRARLGPAGGSGWVAADLAQARRAGDAQVVVPFRVAAAYARQGGGWALVQAHVAYVGTQASRASAARVPATAR
jgi:hypothetical protein